MKQDCPVPRHLGVWVLDPSYWSCLSQKQARPGSWASKETEQTFSPENNIPGFFTGSCPCLFPLTVMPFGSSAFSALPTLTLWLCCGHWTPGNGESLPDTPQSLPLGSRLPSRCLPLPRCPWTAVCLWQALININGMNPKPSLLLTHLPLLCWVCLEHVD